MRLWPFVIFLICIYGCVHDPFDPRESELQMNFVWNPSYSMESKAQVDTGLIWTFSFLGAELESGAYSEASSWNGNNLSIDFEQLGFSETAQSALKPLIKAMKASEEYQVMGAVDIGRMVSVFLVDPENYYAITAMPSRLDALQSLYVAEDSVMVMNSSVSDGPRMILLPASTVPSALSYFAKEGAFDSVNAEMTVGEVEVIDVMDNGQLRFGIFNAAGSRIPWANPEFSFGGKPTKCIWCHESILNPNFTNSLSHPDFASVEQLNERVQSDQDGIEAWRAGLGGDVEFELKQNHAYAELLYIGFYEPSAERLAMEWGTTKEEVQRLLSNEISHQNSEFSFFKSVYHRDQVLKYAPFESVSVPRTYREPE